MKGILPLAVAALLSGAAFAQTSPSGAGSVFDQFDSNHDGNISQAEAQVNSTVVANFAQADTDHDGKLSKSEFDAAFKPANEPMDQAAPPSNQSAPPSDMPSDQPPAEAPPATQPPQK
jgi:hypothetical protein